MTLDTILISLKGLFDIGYLQFIKMWAAPICEAVGEWDMRESVRGKGIR